MAEIILEKKPEQAKLRIYIGAAPGVGKTYHMLNDAYLMKHQQAVDVVIGLVESHGRKETEARIRDLEIVPQKVIPYKGVSLKEMDVDAIIARHPHTVIVDELAHTNVPGSKNRKRYEDVLELLEAGINVMTAVNIQHMETLNDAVNRSANTIDPGDGSGQLSEARRRSGEHRHHGGGASLAAAAGQDLRAGEGGAVAGQLFPQGQPEHAARACAADDGRAGKQPGLGVPAHTGAGAGADSGEGDGLPEHAAGDGAAAARWSEGGRTAGNQLVCGLCDRARTRTRGTATRRPITGWKSTSGWRETWGPRWCR